MKFNELNSSEILLVLMPFFLFVPCDTISSPFTNDTRRTREKSFRYYEAICMNNISERNCFTLRRDRKTFLFLCVSRLNRLKSCLTFHVCHIKNELIRSFRLWKFGNLWKENKILNFYSTTSRLLTAEKKFHVFVTNIAAWHFFAWYSQPCFHYYNNENFCIVSFLQWK